MIKHTTPRAPFKQRMIEHSDVASLIGPTIEADKVKRAEIERLWPLIHPIYEINALKAVIGKESDPQVIDAAVARINELQSEPAKLASARARTLAAQSLRTFAGKLQALLRAASKVSDELIAEADEAEDAFFREWGVEIGGDTKVAQAAKRMKREISDMETRIGRETEGSAILVASPRPNSLCEILGYFTTPAKAPKTVTAKPAPVEQEFEGAIVE